MTAANQYGHSPSATKLRVVTDADGRAIQVFVGALDITTSVARVQTVTTHAGTQHEVVLRAELGRKPQEAAV